jgi:hypothetical protein
MDKDLQHLKWLSYGFGGFIDVYSSVQFRVGLARRLMESIRENPQVKLLLRRASRDSKR